MWVAMRRHQRLTNYFQNALNVFQHIVVPTSEHSIICLSQNRGACCISIDLLAVVTTIQLNYQPFFATAEVDDVIAYHRLACELEPVELTLA